MMKQIMKKLTHSVVLALVAGSACMYALPERPSFSDDMDIKDRIQTMKRWAGEQVLAKKAGAKNAFQTPSVIRPSQGQVTTTSQILRSVDVIDQNKTPGAAYSGTPPDTNGTVGPKQLFLGINNGCRTYNKETGKADDIINVPVDAFTGNVGVSGGDIVVRFDTQTNRFFVIEFEVNRATFSDNLLTVAVSETADTKGEITPATEWKIYRFPHNLIPEGPGPNTRDNGVSVGSGGDDGLFMDYPRFGIDDEALYIGANMFGSFWNGLGDDTRFSETLYVIQKKSLIEGNPIIHAYRKLGDWLFDLDAGTWSGSGTVTCVGVDNFDPKPDYAVTLGFNGSTNNQIGMYRLKDPGSKLPVMGDLVTIDVPQFTASDAINEFFFGNGLAPAQGNLSGFAGFMGIVPGTFHDAHIRNGRLFTSQSESIDNTGNPSNDPDPSVYQFGVRWYEFKNLTKRQPCLVQTGMIYDPNPNPTNYFLPTNMTNCKGDLIIACDVCGFDRYLESVLFTRKKDDPKGAFGPEQLLAASTECDPSYNVDASFGSQRWGDYQASCVDPENSKLLWTVTQYARDTDNWTIRFNQVQP